MSTPFSKMAWFSAALRGADDLSHAQKTVLAVMWTYASSSDGGDIRPGLTRIIEDSGANKKTVLEGLRVLQNRGYIVLVKKGGNDSKRNYASTYRLGYPLRLFEGDDAGVGPVSGPADYPQGGHSFSGSVQSLDRGRSSQYPKVGPATGPVPDHDPIIYPVTESFTIDSKESTAASTSILTKKQRGQLIDRITYEAHTLVSNSCDQQHHQEAGMDTCTDIESFLGDEAAGEWVNYWTVSGKLIERYAAGKKLNQFINACIEKGITLEGASAA